MNNIQIQLEWLEKQKVHYQPVYGHEQQFIRKVRQNRLDSYQTTINNMIATMGDVKDKHILDIGTNLGWYCFKLNEKGAKCTGLDIVPKNIDIASAIVQEYNLHNIEFNLIDATKWVEDNKHCKIDHVILVNVFHHMLKQNSVRAWNMFNWLINNTEGIFMTMRTGDICLLDIDIPETILRLSEASHYKMVSTPFTREMFYFYKSKGE